MKVEFNSPPERIVLDGHKKIYVFNTKGDNIDEKVVFEFGDEWSKFYRHHDKEIDMAGKLYFDIVGQHMVNKSSYVLDVGCGTGRWTKYISQRAGFIEAVDPSHAIFAARKLLADIENVRLSQAAIDTLPFEDETFDFVMSVGVLHHIPNTPNALKDCVKKVKKGGYFYVYLYYNMENRNWLFKSIYGLSDLLRKGVSSLPGRVKRIVCDILATFIYMPIVLLGRFLNFIGLENSARKLPLNIYQRTSFFIIRNDALDRFGTRLEQRFSKQQVIDMMAAAGLKEIEVGEFPHYHAVGKKI